MGEEEERGEEGRGGRLREEKKGEKERERE